MRRRLVKKRKARAQSWCSPWANAKRIMAPSVISLLDDQAHTELLQFLDRLRSTTKCRGFFLIDFSGTTRVHADGMILFRAELCQVVHGGMKGSHFRCKPPYNAKVKEVLQQTGIFKLLGQQVTIQPRHPDVVHWRTANGVRAEGEKSEQVLGEYEGRVAQELLSGLFVGITEAMTNICHHAYMEPTVRTGAQQFCRKNTESGEGWWMFSQRRNHSLHVVICDLGVGIPGSLPDRRPGLVEKLLSFRLGDRDSKYIEFAVEDSISRTGETHRGKGLGQIANGLLQHSPDSELIIFSNRGCYKYTAKESAAFDFKYSIMGTVICWRTPLKA